MQQERFLDREPFSRYDALLEQLLTRRCLHGLLFQMESLNLNGGTGTGLEASHAACFASSRNDAEACVERQKDKRETAHRNKYDSDCVRFTVANKEQTDSSEENRGHDCRNEGQRII